MKKIPAADWIWFSHALITHGRAVCAAQRPAASTARPRALPSAGKAD